MKHSFLVFLAAIALMFTGCGNKADYESEEAGNSATVVRGFYAFDGTGERLREDGSVIGMLFRGFDGPKIYFPGQNLLSTFSESQAKDATGGSGSNRCKSNAKEFYFLKLYLA